MSYKQAPQNVEFVWHSLLVSYVAGVIDQRCINLQWIKDVDTIYLPMNWGKRHWVGLVVDLIKGHITILDPFKDFTSARKVVSFMSLVAELLPQLIKSVCGSVAARLQSTAFTFDRLPGLAQNTRGGDCGPLSVKFMEFHMHGLHEALTKITPSQVDNLRLRYATDIYDHFLSHL